MKFSELDKIKTYKRSHWTDKSWVIYYNTSQQDWLYINNSGCGNAVGVAIRDSDNLVECDRHGNSIEVDIDIKQEFDESEVFYYECVFLVQDLTNVSVKYVYKATTSNLLVGDTITVQSFDNKEAVAIVYAPIGVEDIEFSVGKCKWITGKVLSLALKPKAKTVPVNRLINDIINRKTY